MYGRLTTFPLRPGNRETAEEIARRFVAQLQEQPGHRSTTFYFAEDGAELGSFTLWETPEQAEAVTGTVRSTAEEELRDLLHGPPTTAPLDVFFHDARMM
jgi:quinol monooxygenase YgiN